MNLTNRLYCRRISIRDLSVQVKMQYQYEKKIKYGCYTKANLGNIIVKHREKRSLMIP